MFQALCWDLHIYHVQNDSVRQVSPNPREEEKTAPLGEALRVRNHFPLLSPVRLWLNELTPNGKFPEFGKGKGTRRALLVLTKVFPPEVLALSTWAGEASHADMQRETQRGRA